MFAITLQINSSPKNQLDKSLTDLVTLNGVLKEGSSIIDPIIDIRFTSATLESMYTTNYMTIPIFNRSYFITDVIFYNNALVEIHAHCDVLTSYASAIRGNDAIIYRQENDWNLYLDDGSFQVYNNPNVLTRPFPSGFSTLEFILAVAGA